MFARIPFLFLLLLSLLFSVVSAFPSDIRALDEPSSERVSARINDVFDRLLPGIRKLLYNVELDPFQMKDFHHHLAGILIQNGEFDFTNGWLQGLTDINRAGDVTLSYERKVLTLDMTMGLEVIELSGDYLFRYGIIKREGGVDGHLSNIVARTVLSLDLNRSKIDIDYLRVISVGDMDVKLEGHLDDPLLDVLIKGVTVVFRQQVAEVVQKAFELIFHEIVDDVNERIQLPEQLRQGNDLSENVSFASAFLNRLNSENGRGDIKGNI